ncbi:MAG TPA: hypothetical protein PKI92_01975 [Candidatus Woesebacteria bacterium]|nr:hypothetical protein [Candidatus Woesebacteria bacterium]HPR99467.1 hypothetical protein [Candidatus Woesebacteria bacterium]
MAPLTKEQRSEAARKAAATRRANREAAAARAEETNPHNRHFPWWGFILIGLSILVFGVLVFRPQATQKVALIPLNPTSENAAPTEEPPAEPTPAPTEMPTEAPVVATEAPVTPLVACETIEVSKDDGLTWENAGLSLETESVYDIGNRVTWTSRSSLVDKAPDQGLTDKELKLVENTWLDVRFNACNTEAVVFAHGFEMNKTVFDGGVLFSFKGEQTIRVKNGEIALWYDTQHRDKDLGRIVEQIKIGNFDIHESLAFSFADRLKDVKVVADYLATRPDVKIVILP